MKKVIGIIKNNKLYFFGFFILAAVLFVNSFPKGYVFSGGDTAQLIEAKNNLYNFFYSWDGRAFFYYGLFYILDFLGISQTAQLSWYLGVFIVGSYISFGIFTKLLFNIEDKTRFFISLFYALNLYTLGLFTGNLAFSYYPSLYIFIPILTGFFIKFLKTRRNFYGAMFVLAALTGSSGFGNVAFAVSFFIFLLITLIFLILTKSIIFDRKLAAKLVIIGMLSVLVNSFWILPVIPVMKNGVETLKTSDVLEFSYVIRSTSSPIANTISLLHFSGNYFPDNFIYKNFGFLKPVFFLLSFLPIIIVAFGLLHLEKLKSGRRKMFITFWGIMLVMIMLIARVTEPFEIINRYVYSVWGMEVLRGFDKTAIYFPFVLATLLLIIFSGFESKKWSMAVMILIVLTPLPFFTGKIQQNLSYRFALASPQNKDFQKSKLSFLVKIPDEYYKIRKIINSDQEKNSVATLPYAPNDGSGISNFPKWKMYGTDITRYLYNKKMISANDSYFSDWNFARTFNDENNSDSQWIIKILGMMNVKYIIYHKDVPEDSLINSQDKIKKLEKEGLIKSLESNSYFTLYEICNDYIIPYLSWQDKNIDLTRDVYRINKELDDIENNSQPSVFQELNPKKFIVKTGNIGNILVLSEKYDQNWKAYAVTKEGKETEIKNHFPALDYANGWTIPEENRKNIDHILVEYYPTRLMWRGIYISLATALFLFVYLISYYYGHKKSGQKNNA